MVQKRIPYFSYSLFVVVMLMTSVLLFVENFEKMKYPDLDLTSILMITSTVGKNGFKLSSATAKQVRDKLEKVNSLPVDHEGEVQSLPNDKEKSKAEKVLKKKYKFSSTRDEEPIASPSPRSEVSARKKLMVTFAAANEP